jgi:hypothetical protein
LAHGHFDADRMPQSLEGAVRDGLRDGYQGLWATGDMTWEFGSRREFRKLLDYEWKLEDLFRRQPCISGICQYHIDTLPQDAVRSGLLAHPSIFINETLSRLNPYYVTSEAYSAKTRSPALEDLMEQLCEPDEK